MDNSAEKLDSTAEFDECAVRLAAVLQTTVDAIITANARGLIESFNHAAEEMFRCRASDAIGKNIGILMPDRHASHHDRYMREYRETGARNVIGRTRELTARRFDGSEFPIELALSSAEVGGQRLFTAVIRDISDRRRAEAELNQYRDQLEKLVSDRTAELQASNRRLEQAKLELEQTNAKLRRLIRIDELTSIGNRRAFDERLDLEWRRARRAERPLGLLICDVDWFKKYNDHYGHRAGDECLRRIGGALRQSFQRASEFVARYGGEEFAAIVPGADRDSGLERAEALRQNVRRMRIEHAGLGADRSVTISVGIASTVPVRKIGQDALVEAADAALYRAKQHGRDRVEAADP